MLASKSCVAKSLNARVQPRAERAARGPLAGTLCWPSFTLNPELQMLLITKQVEIERDVWLKQHRLLGHECVYVPTLRFGIGETTRNLRLGQCADVSQPRKIISFQCDAVQ